MKCEICKKEVSGIDAIQKFDDNEYTTVHIFCSEECEKMWKYKKKK